MARETLPFSAFCREGYLHIYIYLHVVKVATKMQKVRQDQLFVPGNRGMCPKFGHIPFMLKSKILRRENYLTEIVNEVLVLKLF